MVSPYGNRFRAWAERFGIDTENLPYDPAQYSLQAKRGLVAQVRLDYLRLEPSTVRHYYGAKGREMLRKFLVLDPRLQVLALWDRFAALLEEVSQHFLRQEYTETCLL